MKKKLTYRDQLLELSNIYNVKEVQDYIRRRKKAVDRDSNRLFKLKKHYTNMSKRKKDPNGDLRFVHK